MRQFRIALSIPGYTDISWLIQAMNRDEAMDIAWNRAEEISKFIGEPDLFWWDGVYDPQYYTDGGA